jgi:hypothetical protein
MKNVLEKIKSILKGIDKKNVLIVCLVVAVVSLGWLSWHSPDPVDVQGLLNKLEARLTEKHQLEIKARDATIKDLSNRVTVSNGVISNLRKKLTEVQNVPIEPPKTNKELRDRFTALGFPPK